MWNLYRKLGLNINVQKTDYLQLNSNPLKGSQSPSIDGFTLKKIVSFKYLGSNISANSCMDDKISFRICQVTGTFGRLSSRVLKNHNIKLHTEVSVYYAVVLSALLYGSETWTFYRRQIKTLENFHLNSLNKILGITWRDKVPHTEVLKRIDCVSLERHRKPTMMAGSCGAHG